MSGAITSPLSFPPANHTIKSRLWQSVTLVTICHMRAHVAYYRVSTQRQGRSGLGLDAQREAVTSYLAGNAGELIAEYTEIETGKRSDRPELASAIAQCRRTGARLVIAKLDRLARNVAFVSALMESGSDFVAADMPQANRLTIHIMAAFAEHEREAISQRTKEALAVVKRNGKQLGNPRPAESLAKGRSRIADDLAEHRAKVRPLVERLRNSGATYRAIAGELEKLEIPTARGKSWDPSTVRRLMLSDTA